MKRGILHGSSGSIELRNIENAFTTHVADLPFAAKDPSDVIRH